MNTLKTIICIAVIGGLIDFAGFYSIVGPFFKRQLSPLLRFSDTGVAPVWTPVVGIYFLIALLVVFFVIPRIDPQSVVLTALGWGALMGFCVYGVYELTNYALLKDWKLSVLFVDILWGTFFGALVSFLGYWVQRFFS